MAAPAGEIFEFGDFTLAPADRLLLLRGRPLRLTPKTFDLLVVLVRHRGSLMTKDRLLDLVWPKVFVAEINLSVNISTLRKLGSIAPTTLIVSSSCRSKISVWVRS